MTIVRVGTNQKYSEGWEAAFGKKKGKQGAESKPAAGKKAEAKKAKK